MKSITTLIHQLCMFIGALLFCNAYSFANTDLKLDIIEIPAGKFRMGEIEGVSDFYKNPDELPARMVEVASFRIGKTEITFDLWDQCVTEKGCMHSPEDSGWGRGNMPVINVSAQQVQEFIAWINKKTGETYRLPSEAEWEYAARAGTQTLNYWGNDIGNGNANCSNCNDSGRFVNLVNKSAAVGSFPANPFGLFDMLGNVAEFTADCWINKGYKDAPADAQPVKTDRCEMVVSRGGSWLTNATELRTSSRNTIWQTSATNDHGFRLAANALPVNYPLITFAVNSSDLSDEVKTVMDANIKVLKFRSELSFIIEGHTDDTGSEAYNHTLSEKRAQAVYDYYIANGIDASRIKQVAFGESRPLVANDSEEGRAKNRSVRMHEKLGLK